MIRKWSINCQVSILPEAVNSVLLMSRVRLTVALDSSLGAIALITHMMYPTVRVFWVLIFSFGVVLLFDVKISVGIATAKSTMPIPDAQELVATGGTMVGSAVLGRVVNTLKEMG
jgi:hypothetical protein